jgi:kynureninase
LRELSSLRAKCQTNHADRVALERELVGASCGNELALVLWPGVQYRTGQAFDCARIAQAAHRVGAIAGFDMAHSIGNLPLSLHDWDVDFARHSSLHGYELYQRRYIWD